MDEFKVFLGGVRDGVWRNILIDYLDEAKIKYYNPVSKYWTPNTIKKEIVAKAKSNTHLFMINTKMTGMYAYFEAAVSAQNESVRTIIVFDEHKCDTYMERSTDASIMLLQATYGDNLVILKVNTGDPKHVKQMNKLIVKAILKK